MKKILALLTLAAFNANAQDVTVSVMAKPLDAYGLVHHDVYLYAAHDIEIVNNSDNDKLFTYSYSMCPEFKKCHVIGNSVKVSPHSKWNNHYDHHMVEQYNFSNNFSLSAKTYVSGVTQSVSDGYSGIIIR